MDALIDHVIKIVTREWAIMAAHREAFLAVLAIGLFFGWTAAWLILRQRITHHKELIEHYQEVVAGKIPAMKRSRALSLGKMLSGVAILLIVTIAPLYILLITAQKVATTDKGSARMGIEQVAFEKIPGQATSRIDVSLINSGTGFAQEVIEGIAGKLVSQNLSPEQIASSMKTIRDLVLKSDSLGPHHLKIPPGRRYLVWLSDIDNVDKDFFLLSDAQVQDFNNGKLAIYVFYFSRFEDEATTGSAYWEEEICAMFVGTFTYWHNCGPQRLDKVSGSRFH